MSDDIFGLSEKALKLSEDRAVLLTNNIVNGSTPHYKAKDIDFHKLVKQAAGDSDALAVTQTGHLRPTNEMNGEPTMYRIPMQASKDGNTVDEEIERKSFLENALNYQVNLTFIKNKSDQLMKAIKGE